MKHTLLVGNGLNRCLESSISWGDLLKDIATEYGVNYNGEIPMPLEFESIVNQYLKKQSNPSDKVYLDIKEKIADKLNYAKLPEGAIHKDLQSLQIESILTTNYDNLLEYVFNPEYSYKGKKTNKYLFDAISIQKGISFFHIHGHADSPKTICLGYEHYMGVVENMRSVINSKNVGSGNMKIIDTLLGNSKPRYTWDEKFYTDNISIIGLGLSESEVDLWWLLSHRAYLYYSNLCGIKKILRNRIVYYDVINESDTKQLEYKKRIHYMLQNSHVEVKYYTIGKDCIDYYDGYRLSITDIQNRI